MLLQCYNIVYVYYSTQNHMPIISKITFHLFNFFFLNLGFVNKIANAFLFPLNWIVLMQSFLLPCYVKLEYVCFMHECYVYSSVV